jgi:hypothetical protein
MSATKEFTYQDVAAHNTKKDIYIVIHDKVYDASSFVDEHPYVYPSIQLSLDMATLHSIPLQHNYSREEN